MTPQSVRVRNLPEVPAYDGVGAVGLECPAAVARRDKRAFIHGPFMSRKVELVLVHRARERAGNVSSKLSVVVSYFAPLTVGKIGNNPHRTIPLSRAMRKGSNKYDSYDHFIVSACWGLESSLPSCLVKSFKMAYLALNEETCSRCPLLWSSSCKNVVSSHISWSWLFLLAHGAMRIWKDPKNKLGMLGNVISSFYNFLVLAVVGMIQPDRDHPIRIGIASIFPSPQPRSQSRFSRKCCWRMKT